MPVDTDTALFYNLKANYLLFAFVEEVDEHSCQTSYELKMHKCLFHIKFPPNISIFYFFSFYLIGKQSAWDFRGARSLCFTCEIGWKWKNIQPSCLSMTFSLNLHSHFPGACMLCNPIPQSCHLHNLILILIALLLNAIVLFAPSAFQLISP